MAGKPFLSHLGGRKGKYKLNKTSDSNKENHMDGKYRQTSSDNDQPPQKKRKTEDEEMGGGDEFWDDSMEFTQADLEDLDVQASQAYTGTQTKTHEEPNVPHPKPSTSTTSHHVTFQEREKTGTFRKPQLSRSSSSSVSSLNAGHYSSMSHNTSSRSSHTSSSHSSYPSSLSSNYRSSSSIKSGSSSDSFSYPHPPSRSLSRGISSESLDITGILGHNVSSLHQDDVNKMKQEFASLKLQMEKLREEICVKDGENKLLRDNLKTKEEELSHIKMEKVTQLSSHSREQSEKEKTLQSDLAKLQTQLHFKEQEEREMKSRCKDLEAQLRTIQAGPGPSQPVPVSPKHLSPKPRRVPVEERSPKAKSGFPTKQTFLAEEVSPQKKTQMSQVKGSQGFLVASASKPRVDEKRMKMRLQTNRQTQSPGIQLFNRLFNTSQASTEALTDKGIIGQLNMPSTPASLCRIQLSRDRTTALFSPAKASISAFQSAVSRTLGDTNMVSIVSTDHHRLAMQGLTNLLLQQPGTDTAIIDHISNDYTHSTSQNNKLLQSDSKPFCDDIVKSIGNSLLDNAVLILPLINDFLHRYIEMLDMALESSNSSRDSISSSSSDPSQESPTGSLGILIKNTLHFANDLERLALSSLQTLSILLSCKGVCDVMLHTEEKKAWETSSTATTLTSIDLELSSKDTSGRQCHIPTKYIVKLKLLQKVIRLANPGSKDSKVNNKVVFTCLKILETLATHATDLQMNNLMPILNDEGLQNCMERTTEPSVITQALHVLCVVCKSNQFVSSLCTNSLGCVLLSMYTICTAEAGFDKLPVQHQIDILHKIVQCVLCIASNHKGGLMILLEADCQCSVEIVKTLVLLLHKVMLLYKAEPRSVDESVAMKTGYRTNQKLDIMREGLMTLHLMSQYDPNFVNRHVAIQHQYIQLIWGLTNIYKQQPSSTCETEMSILQDLWDFDHDDSELSHDSDADDEADTDRSDINMQVA